jgi:hypothetical protein
MCARRKLLLEKTALPKQRSTRELVRAFSENRRAEASLIEISIPVPIMFDFVAGTRLVSVAKQQNLC